MKKCPFNKFKVCQIDCELYVLKTRQYSGELKTEVIQGCTLRLGSDEEENSSNRLAMIHSEVGENKTIGLYTGLSILGVKEGAMLLKKKAKALIGRDDAKAITKDSKTS